MNAAPTSAEIAFYFATLSLMAIGGVNSLIPEMHRQFVEVHAWMSEREFVELVALSQAAPGPNMLVATLLGGKLGGLAGALMATAGMCLPSSLLAYGFARFWQRFQHARWQSIVRDGLAPVTVGLILASGYVLTHAADHGWVAYGVTVATRVHPLWLLGVAGLLGLAGIV